MSEHGEPTGDAKEGEFKEPKKKAKVTRRTLMVQKLSEEWKNLPKEKKEKYQKEAKNLMERWKQDVKRENKKNLEKAKEARENGRGVVKNQKTAYNFYIQTRVKEEIEKAKKKGEKWDHKEIFTRVGKDWENATEKEMQKWRDLEKQDAERFEADQDSFMIGERLASVVSQKQIVNNMPSQFGLGAMRELSQKREYTPFPINLGVGQDDGFKIPQNVPVQEAPDDLDLFEERDAPEGDNLFGEEVEEEHDQEMEQAETALDSGNQSHRQTESQAEIDRVETQSYSTICVSVKKKPQ